MASWTTIARRIRVPLGFLFAILYLWLARPTVVSLLAGAAAAIPGLALRALASGHVRKNQVLTTTGPYAYTRNPLYLGSLILALGFTVAGRSWWIAVAAATIFLAVYVPVISAEEKLLKERFPGFDAYARSVPRFWFRLNPFGGSGSNSFSWNLYWKHREYNALLGSLGMMAALVAKLLWIR